MGFYINPQDCSKEAFLAKNGRLVDTPSWPPSEGTLPVCHVSNGAFTAAAIMYNEGEVKEFTSPDDRRPRCYYEVPKDALKPYLPESFFA